MVTAFFVASFFRLNKVITVLATHVSFPPLIPVIIFLSFEAGRIWIKTNSTSISFNRELSFKTVQINLLQYIYGSISLSIFAGILSFIVCYCLISAYKVGKAQKK
ncbi:MAG: DUF2062 domain-containing protein [Chitinophagia bacterium]|nr:DUF2062 domain-containing protein [Chitinophagia bacterium]